MCKRVTEWFWFASDWIKKSGESFLSQSCTVITRNQLTIFRHFDENYSKDVNAAISCFHIYFLIALSTINSGHLHYNEI